MAKDEEKTNAPSNRKMPNWNKVLDRIEENRKNVLIKITGTTGKRMSESNLRLAEMFNKEIEKEVKK